MTLEEALAEVERLTHACEDMVVDYGQLQIQLHEMTESLKLACDQLDILIKNGYKKGSSIHEELTLFVASLRRVTHVPS